MEVKKFDRRAFLVNMISEFRNKPTEDSIRLTYNNLRRIIEKSQEPEDLDVLEEKRRILEKCYDMFSNEGFRDIIRRGNLSAKQIAQKSAGIILGDKKRKYGMSHKYLDGSVATKEGQYGIVKKDIESSKIDGKTYEFADGAEGTIRIQQIGQIAYTSAFGVQNNKVIQYRIILPLANDTGKEYQVFSNIDLEKMGKDTEYCSAVLDELLSQNNIELSNSGGYIGTICDTRNDSKPLQVGEEREDGKYGDYEYQVSENYKIVYDSQDLSAVMDYETEKNKGQDR